MTGMSTLRAATTVVSPEGRPHDPTLLPFYRDLVGPFGLEPDEARLRAGRNVHHQDLVDWLADDDKVRDSNPDLVVLTHALPDVHPFTAVAPHLNARLGGEAISFGISQQGLAAPFTALRVINSFQQAGRCDTAVLAVLEQTTLPTYHPLTHDTPLVDSGVLLVLGPDGGPQLGNVEAGTATAPLGKRVGDALDAEPAGTYLVLGPWVDADGLPPGLEYSQAEAGTYCTSVWLALARRWREWAQQRQTVLLCDTDPTSGQSHLATFRPSPT